MKTGYLILGIVAVAASIVMKYIGETSSNLSELQDFWYIPLPLGIFALIFAFKKSPEKND